MVRSALAFAAVFSLVTTSAVADASSSYPALVQQNTGAACAPRCSVCHNNPNGGTGTVTTPFGRTMTGLGLIGNSAASLQRALDQLKAQRIDSDGDGDSDIDALVACKDPNLASAGDGGNTMIAASASAPPTPEYGCAIGRSQRGERATIAIALGALCCVRRRRSDLARI